MSDRNDEKNRLWNEVFSKKRTYEEKDDSNIELTIEAPKKEAPQEEEPKEEQKENTQDE